MRLAERRVDGVTASPGVALATAWQPRRESAVDPGALVADPEGVRAAFATVAQEFLALAESMRAKGLREEAAILNAESAIAGDQELLNDVLAAMANGETAGAAIRDIGEGFAVSLEALESAYLRERAADIRQVIRRTLAVIAGDLATATPSTPFVLIDPDVGPVDLLEAAAAGLAGAVSLRGGINAHAAIVARSLGIPLLIGVEVAELAISDGAEVLVDADRSVLIIDPSAEARADAITRLAEATARRQRYALERDMALQTTDGRPVTLLCNVASAPEARIGLDAQASGVGLLRTELPFLSAGHWPTEDMHREVLKPVFAQLDGLPVTVRVMDFSNDKLPPFLTGGPEGLEALLSEPAALRAQLAAVLDVGRRADVRVMLPMVRRPDEVTTVRALLREVAERLSLPAPKLGIMVELPEAVERAPQLAEVADFFSLGTNDLTAAVLGLTRVDQGARPALAAHPRVLANIVATVNAAGAGNISVSVCGDAGGDPLVLPLLLAAGLRVFSVSPARVDEVRYLLRRISVGEWAERLPEVLQLEDVESVWAYVRRASSK